MFTTNNLINYFSVNNLSGVIKNLRINLRILLKVSKIDHLKVSMKLRKNRKVKVATETQIGKE
jgi:hypothetical protein